MKRRRNGWNRNSLTNSGVSAGPLDDGEFSAAQQDRRERIIDAALALASRGGYDAVQMRAVAEGADVALGTVYRYFPSKSHLLIAGLAREFADLGERLKHFSPRATPSERLLLVLRRSTGAMQRDPLLIEAMTRAFLFADASAAVEVDAVGQLTDRMFATAVNGGEPTPDQLALARVVSDVWLSSLVAWVTGRLSASGVTERLELTVRLLLEREDASAEH